jgi:GTPase-activator protein for Ras-like GTPase
MYAADRLVPLVGGFIMLRLVNPALVTPETFSFLPKGQIPSRHSRRNLTLISKLMQVRFPSVCWRLSSSFRQCSSCTHAYLLLLYFLRLLPFVSPPPSRVPYRSRVRSSSLISALSLHPRSPSLLSVSHAEPEQRYSLWNQRRVHVPNEPVHRVEQGLDGELPHSAGN